jgi:hypothetical protein
MTLIPCSGQTVKPWKVKALIVLKRLLIFIGLLLLFAVASAQTIGNWTLNNTLNGTGSAFNTVSPISAGPGIPSTAFNGGTEWYGQNGFPATGAPNANAYLQFTITPNSGYELNIATVVLRMRRSNTGSPAGSGPTQWCLRSSVDGYTANLASGSMTHNYSNYPVTLTGFTHLLTGVTFRLYGYTVTVGSGGNNRLVLDNVGITGSLFILPLELEMPVANADEQGNIVLTWRAHDISAGTLFRLQRSADGASFETIYSITEHAEKTTQRYNYTDRSVSAALLYYRVQAVEPDGTEHISRATSVSRKTTASLHIDKIFERGSLVQAIVQAPAKGNYTLVIHSSTGMLLHMQVLWLENGVQSITIPRPKPTRAINVLTIYSQSHKTTAQWSSSSR